MQDQKTQSWRQVSWVWVIIGLPLTTILGCVFTMFLAFHNADDVVKEDWYKEGLAINSNGQANQTAKKLGLGADLEINNKTGQIHLVLHDTQNQAHKNTILMLSLEHPTLSKHDQIIPLSLNSQDEYTGQLQQFNSGLHYITLTSSGATYWKIKGKIQLMQDSHVTLGYS